MKTTAFCIMIIVSALLAAIIIVMERKRTSVKKLTLIAIMTAMSIAGRFIFAFLPGFKPVTAIVIIAGMYLGADAGFYCGALTALITNCYFGQGPWTPFQMFIWGTIGIFAGLLSGVLQKNRILVMIYGAFSGVIFSLVMDIYTVIWAIGSFSWKVYLVMIGSSLPTMGIYVASNVIFLLILEKTIGRKLEYNVKKYC